MKPLSATPIRRWTAFMFFSFLPLVLIAQFERNTVFTSSGQFDFGVRNYSDVNVGVGMSFELFLFAKKKIGISVESSGDIFFGSDQHLSNGGKFNPSIVALRIGPNWFVTDRILVAGSYGWATYEPGGHQRDGGGSFKVSVARILGKKKNLLARAYFVGISKETETISYFGLGLGYKFLFTRE